MDNGIIGVASMSDIPSASVSSSTLQRPTFTLRAGDSIKLVDGTIWRLAQALTSTWDGAVAV